MTKYKDNNSLPHGPYYSKSSNEYVYFIHGEMTTKEDFELYKRLKNETNKSKLLLYLKLDKKKFKCTEKMVKKRLNMFKPEY